MTRVEIPFRLTKRLDESQMGRIAEARSIYGLLRIDIDPSQQGLTVEYDATRMTPREVHATLARAGIPVAPLPV